MRYLIFAFCLSTGVPGAAQNVQKEINEQVWKPFLEAFNNLDEDAFMAVQSKDVVRVIRDDGRVLDFEEYAKIMASGNNSARLNKGKRKLELRFAERWVNDKLASE